MAKKSLKLTISILDGILNGDIPLIFMGADNTPEFVDRKPTGNFSATVIKAMSEDLGEVTLIFPYRKEAAEKWVQKFSFGDLIRTTDVGVPYDGSISFYNESFYFKFLLNYREEAK